MQIKRTNSTDTEITLSVIAKPEELTSFKQHVLGHFRGRVKIAGFREGKAPLELIEKNVDEAAFQSEFLEEAINNMYSQAISDEKLRPVANPEISIKKFVPYETLEFEAKVTIIGDIKLPDYKKVKKAKPEVTITANDVKDVLANLQNRAAEHKDVDRAAKLTDQVYIDFSAMDADNSPVEGADGKDYPLVLGSGSFIPGFEENVVGMKGGDEKSFPVTFPDDYHAKQLMGVKVTFTVTVTKVQEVILPKLDDKFAKSVGPFESLQQLKDDIKTQLSVERQAESDRQYENELVGELADKMTVAIPKVLIDEQVQKIEEQERQQLIYRGQTWEEHLKEEGVTAEEHAEKKRPEAERGIKASLLLAEIADSEGLDVTPDELSARVEEMKVRYSSDQAMQGELSKPENQRDIASRMLTEKAIEKLMSYATS